jgi:hypothetical protein
VIEEHGKDFTDELKTFAAALNGASAPQCQIVSAQADG